MHFASTNAFKLGSHLLLVHSSFRVLYLSLLMNQSDLKDSCEKYFGFETNSFIVMFTDTARGFIAGLASFQGKPVCFVVYVTIHECQHTCFYQSTVRQGIQYGLIGLPRSRAE